MAQRTIYGFTVRGWAMAALLFCGVESRGDAAADTQSQLHQLQQQNEVLQEQLRKQQQLIESLSKTVKEIQAADANRFKELDDLKFDLKETAPPKSPGSFGFGKVNIS